MTNNAASGDASISIGCGLGANDSASTQTLTTSMMGHSFGYAFRGVEGHAVRSVA